MGTILIIYNIIINKISTIGIKRFFGRQFFWAEGTHPHVAMAAPAFVTQHKILFMGQATWHRWRSKQLRN